MTSKEKGEEKTKLTKRKVRAIVLVLNAMQMEALKNSKKNYRDDKKSLKHLSVTRCDLQTVITMKTCFVFNATDYTVLECIRAGSKLITRSNQHFNGVDAID